MGWELGLHNCKHCETLLFNTTQKTIKKRGGLSWGVYFGINVLSFAFENMVLTLSLPWSANGTILSLVSKFLLHKGFIRTWIFFMKCLSERFIGSKRSVFWLVDVSWWAARDGQPILLKICSLLAKSTTKIANFALKYKSLQFWENLNSANKFQIQRLDSTLRLDKGLYPPTHLASSVLDLLKLAAFRLSTYQISKL